jgi:hypothetical protein
MRNKITVNLHEGYKVVKVYEKTLGTRSPYAPTLRAKGHGVEKPKKGKGSYTRKSKHTINILV